MSVRGLDRGQRAALVINECQNAMVSIEHSDNAGLVGEIESRRVLPTIAALAGTFRTRSLLVVHSTIVLRDDDVGMLDSCLLLGALRKKGAVRLGSPGAQIHRALTPVAGDYVSERLHGLTPFHGTELEAVLRSQGVQTVVVTGVSTNVGVPGTCLELVNRGFSAVVVEDGVAGSSREIHDFQLAHTVPLLATVATAAQVAQAVLG